MGNENRNQIPEFNERKNRLHLLMLKSERHGITTTENGVHKQKNNYLHFVCMLL